MRVRTSRSSRCSRLNTSSVSCFRDDPPHPSNILNAGAPQAPGRRGWERSIIGWSVQLVAFEETGCDALQAHVGNSLARTLGILRRSARIVVVEGRIVRVGGGLHSTLDIKMPPPPESGIDQTCFVRTFFAQSPTEAPSQQNHLPAHLRPCKVCRDRRNPLGSFSCCILGPEPHLLCRQEDLSPGFAGDELDEFLPRVTGVDHHHHFLTAFEALGIDVHKCQTGVRSEVFVFLIPRVLRKAFQSLTVPL